MGPKRCVCVAAHGVGMKVFTYHTDGQHLINCINIPPSVVVHAWVGQKFLKCYIFKSFYKLGH